MYLMMFMLKCQLHTKSSRRVSRVLYLEVKRVLTVFALVPYDVKVPYEVVKHYEVIKKVPYEVKYPVDKPYDVKVEVPKPYEGNIMTFFVNCFSIII